MSERKGHGSRGSLMDLAKPRLAQTPLSAPIDEAERLILSGESQATGAALAPATPAIEQAPVEHPQPTAVNAAGGLRAGDRPTAETPKRHYDPHPSPAASEDILAKLRKNRQPIAVVGFKLPARLKDELSTVAQYNGTDMTRIVVEALERFLPNLPHPPEWR